jgi:hypothetical protein
MADRAELKPRDGNPEHIVVQFKLLGIVEVATQVAVDAAIADQLRVMNIEGKHTEAQAFASLLVDNPKGGVVNALNAAREYDLIHGSAILPVVESGLRARHRQALGS